MSSETVGTSATIKESCPFAEYYHCSAHALNLCLVHSSKGTAIRNMIDVVKEVTSFFSRSNKRGIVLQKAMEITKRNSCVKKIKSCQKQDGLREWQL